MDISALLDRCRQGDELAWEALIRQYQSRVYSVTYHYVGNAEDARDLAQETFIRIYRTLDRVEAETLLPWILRVARNAAVDFLRRRGARPPSQDLAAEDLPSLRSLTPGPEEECSRLDRKRLVQRALARLTRLNREIIILKEIQEMPLQEIAAFLGVPLGTVKSRSNRARIELGQTLVAMTRAGARPED
jgi:RNA polymerase sigma-70 factor (ECF subfamily)